MEESWMLSDTEIGNIGAEESKDDKIERLEKIVEYLVNKDESNDVQCKIKKEYVKVQTEKRKALKPSTGFTKVHKMINQKAVRSKMFRPAEERMLFKLIPFCNLESSIICDEEGFSMSQKDIIELTGMGKKDVQDIMESLEVKGVLTKHVKNRTVFYKFSKEWFGQ
jgi:hypothetical protein